MSYKVGKKASPLSIAEITTIGLRIIQCYINKKEGNLGGGVEEQRKEMKVLQWPNWLAHVVLLQKDEMMLQRETGTKCGKPIYPTKKLYPDSQAN